MNNYVSVQCPHCGKEAARLQFGESQLRSPEEEAKVKAIEEAKLQSVEELCVGVRAYNRLKNLDINTVGELIKYTEGELLRSKNFGRKSLNELVEILRAMGLSLASDPRPESSSNENGAAPTL